MKTRLNEFCHRDTLGLVMVWVKEELLSGLNREEALQLDWVRGMESVNLL